MDLFSLPEVVLQGHLLPYLNWSDLLSLRRVCKAAKPVVQNYLKVYKGSAPEIEIGTRDDEQGRNLETFLKMGVYSSRIFLNNRSGVGFYENNDDGTIQRFLEEHGAKVKHLRVNYWTLYCTGKEKQFLEALVNLEKFEANNFTLTTGQNGVVSDDIVPIGFRQLTILKLNQPLDMDISAVIANAKKLLASCPNLKVLSLPFLKILELTISCEGTIAAGEEDQVNARTVFNFRFLHSVFLQNGTLTNYRLNFTTTCLGVPELHGLVGSCANLKNLTISNWIGTNEQLARLWVALRGFPLEEIVFENCGKLEDRAFIGDDTSRGAFMSLARNLKRLTLNGLDQMPGITDTLFSVVICRLRLTHLVLTSNQPVRSITKSGILSLVNRRGRFRETIESFPFVGWSLENVSEDRFQQLALDFARILQRRPLNGPYRHNVILRPLGIVREFRRRGRRD